MMGNLTNRSLRAVKWNYLGVLARIAFQLIVQVTLARLLGPDALGLFAFAILVLALSNVAVEMGLGSALVQRREITESDTRHVFTTVIIAGLIVATTVYICAPLCALVFADQRVTSVVRGVAPAIVFQAFAITPAALLRRDLAFKEIQAAQIGSYVFGFLIVGVGFALLGAGVWSLVFAWLAQTGASAVVFYFLRKHSMKPLLSNRGGELDRFGRRVLFTNIANWLVENMDNLLVGRFFGAISLGLYSLSYNMVRTPANHLVATLQSVLFPASARAQGNLAGLQRAYLSVVSAVALVAGPLFFGVAAVADTLVIALFGDKWIHGAPMLVALAIAMVTFALMAVAGPILWGKGVPSEELKVQLGTVLVMLIGLGVAGRFSATAMAWTVSGVYALRMMAMTVTVLRQIDLPVTAFFRGVRGGILSTLLVLGVLLFVDSHLLGVAEWIKLAVDVSAALGAFALFVYRFPGLALSKELAVLVQALPTNMPGMSSWIRRVRAAHMAANVNSSR